MFTKNIVINPEKCKQNSGRVKGSDDLQISRLADVQIVMTGEKMPCARLWVSKGEILATVINSPTGYPLWR